MNKGCIEWATRRMAQYLGLVMVAVLPMAAQASVVFSSLEPIVSNSSQGQSIGIDGLDHFALASRFTASGTGTLSDVTLALFRQPQNQVGGLATVTLHADNAGALGAQLATGSGTPVDIAQIGASNLNVAMSAVSLVAGTAYWLEIDAGAPSLNWLISTVAGTTVGLFGAAGLHVPLVYQFSVQVTDPTTAPPTVPEPGSLALLGLALAGMAMLRRRTRA